MTTGLAVPFFMKSPYGVIGRRGQMTDVQVSLLDVMPTVLDWFGIDYPRYHILKPSQPTVLAGRSLLPFLHNDTELVGGVSRSFFASHVTHEVTMNYPMRTIVENERFKLIHNLNGRATPFPIDQDFYVSPTFQVLCANSRQKAFQTVANQ